MADEAVAPAEGPGETKQPSVVSTEDTVAQTGTTVGEHCVSDRPLPTDGVAPSGEHTKINNIDVYIAKPADYPHLPSKLLILLSSGTGIHSQNNQIQADKYASEGFLVVMPDQFNGDPFTTATTDHNIAPEDHATVIEKVKVNIATTAKSFLLDMWLARHTPERVFPIITKVIDGAKEEFADAVANGGGVYAVGYCFGGKYVCMLAAEQSEVRIGLAQKGGEEAQDMVEKKGPAIKVGALAHGTLITKEDMEGIKAPISFVCIENDSVFPDEVRNTGQEFLEKEQREHELKTYPGMPHGFATVGEYTDPAIGEAQEAAFEQMVAWLKAH